MTAVGYSVNEEPNYYLVKNSWGTDWGENGYVRIGIQQGQGVCGIQMEPTYADLVLSASMTEFYYILVLLGFGLLFVAPLSIRALRAKKRATIFLHPGQRALQKILWWEFFLFLVLTTLWSISSTKYGSFAF